MYVSVYMFGRGSPRKLNCNYHVRCIWKSVCLNPHYIVIFPAAFQYASISRFTGFHSRESVKLQICTLTSFHNLRYSSIPFELPCNCNNPYEVTLRYVPIMRDPRMMSCNMLILAQNIKSCHHFLQFKVVCCGLCKSCFIYLIFFGLPRYFQSSARVF